MKDTKAAGTRRENQVKRLLEDAGWLVMRAPASLGAADLVALKAGTTARLLQVKANVGSPYKTFGRKERRELIEAAEKAGAVAELVHWPPHGECRWVPSVMWP